MAKKMSVYVVTVKKVETYFGTLKVKASSLKKAKELAITPEGRSDACFDEQPDEMDLKVHSVEWTRLEFADVDEENEEEEES